MAKDFFANTLSNKAVKIQCEGDVHTYILKNKSKRSFTAVLENRPYFNPLLSGFAHKMEKSFEEGNVLLKYNEDTHDITISLTIPDPVSESEAQQKYASFKRLTNGLWEDSASTACYLKCVDFFNRQLESFYEEVTGLSAGKQSSVTGFAHEHYTGPNMAY